MNKLGIFVNFWENNWECDLSKYINKANYMLEYEKALLLKYKKVF